MAEGPQTCWTTIRDAGGGDVRQRETFARRYACVVEAAFRARWRASPLRDDVADAVQEVFLECFRQGGVLERADPTRPGGFRPFLYGVVRNVAQRFEERRARGREDPSEDLDATSGDETTLSTAFDRAWAEQILREAARVQARRAQERGERAARRVELLRLRFQENLPIREIARRWQADPANLHHEYATARQEFEEALVEVLTFHRPDAAENARREAADLVQLLG